MARVGRRGGGWRWRGMCGHGIKVKVVEVEV